MKNLLTSFFVSLFVLVVAVNVPAYLLSYSYWEALFSGRLGAFTTLNSTDTISTFPTTYNANLTKTIEVGTTSVASITALPGLTTANALTSATSLATLAALTSVGTLTTGTWNATVITVPYGGTGWAKLNAGYILVGNDTTRIATSSNLYFDTTNSRLGISSSTPAYGLSLGSQKAIGITEYFVTPTTSPITIDARNGNQQVIQLGGDLTATTTIQFSNFGVGTAIRLVVCNPSTKAASTTFSGARYFGGIAATQTQTANQCDMYVVGSTQSTSTSATTPIIWVSQGGAGLQ